MQVPRANHDLAATQHHSVAKDLRFSRTAHHHRHRRIKAQRFAKDITRQFQLPRLSNGALAQRRGLRSHLLLPLWVER